MAFLVIGPEYYYCEIVQKWEALFPKNGDGYDAYSVTVRIDHGGHFPFFNRGSLKFYTRSK